ncbi:MAG: glycosyltransferase family 1 protein [Chloroflexi bacterium]|jgi:glycosyltransferase involved in cell wall biosynthesis|uniref:Glycosyltransferase family 1 protein n=1 Tax=Candidatus Thermofonsia Clade 3 bacterium TaxID=2364212 RepID=A0A2M8QB40_9CHLR|nr:glycosyltransferase family 4 protein [Candidatus Roseilinea sp. NK_OTU-006]PJF47018.1 MAG: glycosyltransferase family 1 protein [Candidatus Thermofonsia Clade 3 bacterium]RMG64744.1 MAG: glycosyltransferase family 1 protein [Chloroflexota bacterium]
MHILSLAPTSFFSDYGCHVRILEEARALQALGHQVTILTYYKGSDVPGIRIVRTMPTPWHRDYEVGSSRHKFAFDALLGIRLLRVLSRNRFDVIHAHLHEGALIAGVLARPWRIPVIFDYQGSLTDELLQHRFIKANSMAHAIFRRVEQVVDRIPHAVLTSTRHAASALRAKLGDRVPVQALPDGVNSQVFRPDVLSAEARAHLRARWGIAPDEPLVVFIGLLAAHQGIRNLIEAAARLKAEGRRLRWLVMGYPGVETWQRVAAEAGTLPEVIFTGRVPYLEAPRMLALGDLAVAPKLSLTEGSGKILNYMAMALPTVAFDTPAQREYLGALGVYAPPGDSEALARRVADLLDHPQRRRMLGEQLRHRAVQRFGWEHAASVMTSLYEQLLARSKTQPVRPRRHQQDETVL